MSGEGHHFTITVRLRGDEANWSEKLVTQEVRAWNLRDALTAAAELPLAKWFEDPEWEYTT